MNDSYYQYLKRQHYLATNMELNVEHKDEKNKEDIELYFETFREAAEHHKKVMKELNSDNK